MQIALTGDQEIVHPGSPAAQGFKAPPLAKSLKFSKYALAASMARTATLQYAPLRVLFYKLLSSLPEVFLFVGSRNGFELDDNFHYVAESERIPFAGKVGSAITDLYMNALGYVWRANLSQFVASNTPHGDFLYGGGRVEELGVVLAEATGSFANDVTDAERRRKSASKYTRQVRPHVGSRLPLGQIVHGYALAFGSHPDNTGTFFQICQTAWENSSVPDDSSYTQTQLVSGQLALTTYRANFIIMGALPIVYWIDRLMNITDDIVETWPLPEASIVFDLIERDGRRFLVFDVSNNEVRRYCLRCYKLCRFWVCDTNFDEPIFAMELSAAKSFLNALTGMINSGRVPEKPLELPVAEISGFGGEEEADGRGEDGEGGMFVLFRDGLAFINHLDVSYAGVVKWSPFNGISR